MEDIKNWKLVWRKQRNKWVAREQGGKRRQISLGTTDEEHAKLILKKKLGLVNSPKENLEHLELGKTHPTNTTAAIITTKCLMPRI